MKLVMDLSGSIPLRAASSRGACISRDRKLRRGRAPTRYGGDGATMPVDFISFVDRGNRNFTMAEIGRDQLVNRFSRWTVRLDTSP